MTTTTIDHRAPVELFRPVMRLALAAVLAVALLVSAFVVGRATASSRSTTPGVTRPAASVPAPADFCSPGRLC